MKLNCSILLCCLISATASAQIITKQERNYFNITQVSFLPGIGHFRLGDTKYKFDGKSYGLNTINGLFLTNKTSLGLGIGIQGIHNPNFNTARIFIEIRQYLQNKRNGFFATGEFGYNPRFGTSTIFTQGTFGEIGVGYKLLVKRIGIVSNIGYQIQHINTGSYKTNLNSLSISTGILF